ncbi:hypothetical protein [Streptomyces sp. enrichment culture]|uniref:hypothetical protein n=1 Tax=Streptomyces sp. enrichment culture TaxID=1795815 RepID=UPI003F56B556
MTEQQQGLAVDTTRDPAPEPPAPGDRRALRAALRWTAAAVVFALAGAGTAYGISRMERTDVPGLATASDGRWDYPPLTKPPLPSGSPGPRAESNPAGTHHADLRALLLPLPQGAKEDEALRGTDGWLPAGEFLKEYAQEGREAFGQQLTDSGLRHIAARGWTTGDGTRTRIYLLHFDSSAVVETSLFLPYFSYEEPAHPLRGTGRAEPDASLPEEKAAVPGVQRSVYDESAPRGAEHDRQAYLAAGDVLAVVLQSRKGTAHAVPFQQTVVLQSRLLG